MADDDQPSKGGATEERVCKFQIGGTPELNAKFTPEQLREIEYVFEHHVDEPWVGNYDDEPPNRVPPIDGLNGGYWKHEPWHYTIINSPEASEVMMQRVHSRLSGRAVGNCTFCAQEYREADYLHGKFEFGNCKLWCVNIEACLDGMEKMRDSTHPVYVARRLAPKRKAVPQVVADWGAEIKHRWDASEAALAALPRKQVRFKQSRESYAYMNSGNPFLHNHGRDYVDQLPSEV
jgi:hypothetical protein